MEYRVKKLRESLVEREIEALLIHHPLNRRYLTGFTGSSGMVLITQEETLLITDFRYLEQVKIEAPHCRVVEHTGNHILKKVAEVSHQLGLKSLHFEADTLTFVEYQRLKDALSSIRLEPSVGITEELRKRKDQDEVAVIKEAVAIADRAYTLILDYIRPGRTEKEIALKLEMLMREMGAESVSFPTIVASGVRSSYPHGVASDKKVEPGDLITLDFGAQYKGYVSDITRNVVLGEPTAKQRELHQIVLTALEKTKQRVRAGMPASQADAIARDFITESGYGDYFGHGTGHGIGLDVHESPRVGSSSDEKLVSGMVITVEPGIYIPEFGGIRIEDDIYISETGIEVLTQSPRDLIQID